MITVCGSADRRLRCPCVAVSFGAQTGGGELIRVSRVAIVAVLVVATQVVGIVDAARTAAAGSAASPTRLVATLSNPQAVGACFGCSVAADGDTIVVGAPDEFMLGRVYVYTRTARRWPATPSVTLVDPNPTLGDTFGYSVALFGDTLIV